MKTHTTHIHVWHVGAVLALYNMLLLLVLGFFGLLFSVVMPLWWFVGIVAPLMLTGFWLWYGQEILHQYKRVAIHDALIIAKFGVLPFVFFFLVSIVVLDVLIQLHLSLSLWGVLAYYSMIFSAGAILLEFTVVFFGLHHHIRLPKEKKAK